MSPPRLRAAVAATLLLPAATGASAAQDGIFTEDAADEGVRELTKLLNGRCQNAALGLDRVYLGLFEHGGNLVRGLGAARPIAEGENFLCLPRQCWFNINIHEAAAPAWLRVDAESAAESAWKGACDQGHTWRCTPTPCTLH